MELAHLARGDEVLTGCQQRAVAIADLVGEVAAHGAVSKERSVAGSARVEAIQL